MATRNSSTKKTATRKAVGKGKSAKRKKDGAAADLESLCNSVLELVRSTSGLTGSNCPARPLPGDDVTDHQPRDSLAFQLGLFLERLAAVHRYDGPAAGLLARANRNPVSAAGLHDHSHGHLAYRFGLRVYRELLAASDGEVEAIRSVINVAVAGLDIERIIGAWEWVGERLRSLPDFDCELLEVNIVKECERALELLEDDPRLHREKRGTSPGEASGKMIGVLNVHHNYQGDDGLTFDPIDNNALARQARVDKGSASKFIAKFFGSHAKYRAACNDPTRLVTVLKKINADHAPRLSYDPDRDDRSYSSWRENGGLSDGEC